MSGPSGSASERGWRSYQRTLVPRLAAPFAADIAAALQGDLPGDLVVDVAAGTGATGDAVRLARPRARVVSVDLDATALMVGRAAGRNSGLLVADAMRLPIRDGVAGAVVCQQGLQFMPELAAACCEAYRVLRPGGRLVAVTWGVLESVSVFAAMARLADEVGVGPAFADACTLAPAQLAGCLEAAGFAGVSQHEVVRRVPDVDTGEQLAELLVHWTDGVETVLTAPWGAATPAVRASWLERVAAELDRRDRAATAVVTTATRS